MSSGSLVPNYLRGCFIILASVVFAGCSGDSQPDPFQNNIAGTDDPSDTSASGEWQLVWSEEFSGNSLDQTSWNYDIGLGTNGWGNNELQYYGEDNARVSGGFLTIEAREESFGGADYTSARLTSAGKRFFRYGKFEIRAKLPQGQGLWPAVWMLGESFTSIGWPYSGEIDIMEMIGGAGRENTVLGTMHWDDNGHVYSGGDFTLNAGTFADDFHVFSIEWDSQTIKWFVDGQQFHIESISSAAKSEFREEFFFLLNVAVGGNLPGSPNSTTTFPQQMVIDYIRVFEPM